MSETMPADQSSASMTGSAKAERRLLVAGGILVALALAVAMLRFYRLSELGPGLLYDEASNSLDALRVLDGEHAVFFPEKSYGREAMVVYAIALAISFLGRTLLAARLPIALASAGTVFFVFWLGQILFGQDEESGRATPWRGLLVGGVGGCTDGGFRQSDDPGSHCVKSHLPAIRFFHCVWLCSGGGGGNVSAAAEPGGGLRWQGYAPGCCRTLIFQRV